jgi:hypothetical protein
VGVLRSFHVFLFLILLLSLAPQPSLGLGLLHKIRLNFLEASQQFSFLQGRVVSPTPNAQPPSRGTRPLYLYPPEAEWLHTKSIFWSNLCECWCSKLFCHHTVLHLNRLQHLVVVQVWHLHMFVICRCTEPGSFLIFTLLCFKTLHDSKMLAKLHLERTAL